MWSPRLIERMSRSQKTLLESGFLATKLGGTLVYSTCTLEPAENEAVVSSLLEKYKNAKIEKISLNIKRSKPIKKFKSVYIDKDVNDCLPINPQDNDTEGFFVAKFKKE